MIAGESSFLSHLSANDPCSELKEVMAPGTISTKFYPRLIN